MLQEPPQELSVSYQRQADGTVVEVVGELHLPNVRQFQESLHTVISEHEGVVLLDFRQVSFLDSAGLMALLTVRKQLSLQSRPLNLRLIAGSQPDHVVRTCRVNTIITLVYE